MLADVEQADGELVAAQARHQVLVAQCLAETQGHLPQQFVADAPAQGVVDQLKAVQVDEQHAAEHLAALRHAQGLVDQLGQQGAVGQAGQRIVICQVVQALFGQLAFRDVRQVGDEADGLVVHVVQRRQGQAGPEDLARLLAAAHFHQAPALLQESVVETRVLVVVQEQDVAPHGFHRGVAEQALGALVPAGDVARQVHRQHGFVQLVEDLRLLRQQGFHLRKRMGRALRQRMHLQHAGRQRCQAGQVAAVGVVVQAAAGHGIVAVAMAVEADFLQQGRRVARKRRGRRGSIGADCGQELAIRAGHHGAGDAAQLGHQCRATQAHDGVAQGGAITEVIRHRQQGHATGSG